MSGDLAVVDASAIASLLFGERRGVEIGETLEGRELLAPTLLRYELGSICLKKRRKYPEMAEWLLQALGFLDHLRVREAGVVEHEVIELAEMTSLTYYDACYLWLARELGAELITLDARLRDASR